MKKLLAIVLTLVMVVSMIAACIPASAAAAADPTFEGSLSKVTSYKCPKFWMNSLNYNSLTIDHDYASSSALTWNDKEIALTPGSTQQDYSTAAIYQAFGTVKMGIKGGAGIAITINGMPSADGYVNILSYEIDSSAGLLNSFLISVPNHPVYGQLIPDGFTLFASDSYWNETESYKIPNTVPSETEFRPLAIVTGLNEGEGKWTVSTDGSFKFYEANFSEPVDAKYITIAWTRADWDTVTKLRDEKGLDNIFTGFNELAFYTDSIPSAPIAPKPTSLPQADTTAEVTTREATSAAITTKAPVETKDPVTTAAPAVSTDAPATDAPATEPQKVDEKKGCGSVAAIGVAVVVTVLGTAVLRKKEN